jgi:hypothetical protein
MPASSSPRIVLHVGALKTASTYLQRRMGANLARLREHGIYLPVLPAVAQMAGNAKLLTTALNRRPTSMFQRAFPNIDVSKLDPAQIVAELLEGWRPADESVVLSDESLRPEHARRLRELLPNTVPCVVVLFVRRQDRWVDSYFNQLVKTNQSDGNITTFVTRVCEPYDGELFRPDWYAQYEGWREVFGNCRVVFYDKVESHVFSGFIAAAGLQPVPDLAEIEPAQVSLDIYQLAYLLDLEKPIALSDFLHRRVASEKASQRFGRQKVQSLLTSTDLSQLRDRFDASNRQLLSALGREDDPSLLQLDRAPDSDWYCDLPSVYASEGYCRYQKLADAISARRSRHHRLKSLLKGRLFSAK